MQTIKKYFEFSKIIAYVMTILVFWISYRSLDLQKIAIVSQYNGSLPFLTTMIAAVWGAYATVMSFMFNKSKAENVVKIKNSAFSKEEYST